MFRHDGFSPNKKWILSNVLEIRVTRWLLLSLNQRNQRCFDANQYSSYSLYWMTSMMREILRHFKLSECAAWGPVWRHISISPMSGLMVMGDDGEAGAWHNTPLSSSSHRIQSSQHRQPQSALFVPIIFNIIGKYWHHSRFILSQQLQAKTFTIYSFISARWLRPGAGQECADQDVQQRGGDAVVPAAGRAAGLHRVLHPHWYVGRGLHFLRDGQRPSSLPRLDGRGRAPPDI